MQMQKYKGFIKAMKDFKFASYKRDNLINTSGLDWYDGYTATQKFLSLTTRPTAIVGGSYDISGGIIRGIKEANLDIPKDISIISYDNIPQMENMEIPLTSIGVPVDQLAVEIVQSMIKIIEEQDSQPVVTKMTPQLTVRASCE